MLNKRYGSQGIFKGNRKVSLAIEIRMVYPGFIIKNKTNECHNKCCTGCHGDDISDQEDGHFYPSLPR